MKNNLLTLLLFVPFHFVIAQNVKIIHASERSATENRAVITPAPSSANTVPASAVNTAKTKPSEQRKDDVKAVKGCSEKKQCVKKVDSQKKDFSLPLKGKSIESVKK